MRTGSEIKNSIVHTLFMAVLVFGCTTALAQPSGQNSTTAQLKRLASSYERAELYDKAAEVYRLLCVQNPTDLPSYLAAKRCYLKIKEYDKLTQLIRELQSQRRDIRYEIDLAEIEYLMSDFKKAKEHWDQILTDNSRNQDAYALLGAALIENRLYDDAIAVYQRGRKNLKDDYLFIFELANVYLAMSDTGNATREYLYYLEKNPNQVAYIDTRIARLEQDEDATKEIAQVLKKALKEKTKIDQEILQLLGNLYTRNRQYDEAFHYYQQLPDSTETENKSTTLKSTVVLDFGETARRDGSYEYAKRAFEFVIEKFPQSPSAVRAQYGLATLFESQEQYAQAVNAYQNFIDGHPNTTEALRAMLQVGDLWFEKLANIPEAKKTYNDILRRFPGSAYRLPVLYRLAECELATERLDGAEQIYQRILAESDKDIKDKRMAKYNLALVEFSRGHPTRSKTILADLVDNPQIHAVEPDENENDILDLFYLIQDKQNDSTGLAVLGRARFLFRINELEKSRLAIRNFVDSNPQTLLADEFAMLLIDVYRGEKNYTDALSQCQELLKNDAGFYRDRAMMTRAEIYEFDLKEYAQAQQAYESLLEKFPNSIYIEDARRRIRSLEKMN
jgi:tetratricopeptide (TPR) repeat protein